MKNIIYSMAFVAASCTSVAVFAKEKPATDGEKSFSAQLLRLYLLEKAELFDDGISDVAAVARVVSGQCGDEAQRVVEVYTRGASRRVH